MRLVVFATVVALAGLLHADTVIEQESNGLVGSTSGEKRRQTLYIKGDRLRLVDEEAGVDCVVRLDKKVIWEIDHKNKKYVETHFSYFEANRRERERNRLNLIKALNERFAGMQRRTLAARRGFLLDENEKVIEKITAGTEQTGRTAEIAGHKCRQVLIKEDARLVFELWLTDEIKLPQSVIRFYRDSGMLSEPVRKELDELKGFPLKVVAHIDVGVLQVKVEAEATKVEERGLKDEDFELPEGYECGKVKKAEPGKKTYRCAQCGKEFTVDTAGGEAPITWVRRGGKLVLRFCCEECLEKYKKRVCRHAPAPAEGDEK